MNRDLKMLDGAADQSCIRCGRIGETRAAHYSGFRQHMLGKGRGIKGNDRGTADFCHACDTVFSEASYGQWPGGSKNVERSEEFLFYILLTNIRRDAE